MVSFTSKFPIKHKLTVLMKRLFNLFWINKKMGNKKQKVHDYTEKLK